MTENSPEVLDKIDHDLNQLLKNSIESVWAKRKNFLENLAKQGHQIAAIFSDFGNQHYALLEQVTDSSLMQQQTAYVATYYWPEQAKAFLLLWRDILFENQRANLLLQSGDLAADRKKLLQQQSKETAQIAAQELAGYLDKKLQQLRKGKGGMAKHVEQLRLQKNPWLVYQKQIQVIVAQMDQLLISYEQLSQTGERFQSLQSHLKNILTDCKKEIEQHEQIAQQTKTFIEDDETLTAGKVALHLEDIESNIHLPNHLNHFLEIAEKETAELAEKVRVPIAIAGGIIQEKELNFRRSVRLWFDSEILPLLYEIWELTELNANGLKMALLNMRNRSLLLASEQIEGRTAESFDRADLVQPLQAFQRKLTSTLEDFQRIQDLVDQRLANDFQLAHIYHPTNSFLPVPLQSTINKLRVDQNAVVVGIQQWAKKQNKAFQRLRKTVEIEESLSISEKVVRYLQSRNWETTNTPYNSIFLTKGYIGESFWVGRMDELVHIRKLVADWKNGFRGAVALSGQRLSGKSLFGELVANRFFAQNTIRLLPQSNIRVQGRPMSTSYDLEEALSFIRKYTLNKPCLVWIDDLELWQDPTISLAKNINALRRYIDDYSSQLFFMVAMNTSLRFHLDHFQEISKVFQAEINLDKMPLTAIREAIMIRHGATHKELLNAKEREMTPKQFQQITAKVHKVAHGNIGEALNIWAFSTLAVDDEHVKHELKALYELPDFVNPDNALLLRSIILTKKTNEYRLRKLFGPTFSEKYSGVLQRLISVGLLRRTSDGWLEINEAAANDLGRLLDRKQYLKFQR